MEAANSCFVGGSVACEAIAFSRTGAVSIDAPVRAVWDAHFPVAFQDVAVVAGALAVSGADSVDAGDRAGRNAVSCEVEDVAGVAFAFVRSRAVSVHTTIFTDRFAMFGVQGVRRALVAAAADENFAKTWTRLEKERKFFFWSRRKTDYKFNWMCT